MGLKELEKALGVQLVERDRQSVLMTPVGLEVVKRARTILVEARDLVEVAARAHAPMAGLLRLGVIPTIAPFLLPPCLRLLRRYHPSLRLALREDRTAQLLMRLEGGELDAALIALPFDTGQLRVLPLFEENLWIVGQKADSQLKSRSIRLVPTLVDRLLLLEEGHCLREHSLVACGTAPKPAAEGVEATSLLTLLQMVESGLGIGLVPEMAVRSGFARSVRLRVRRLREPQPKRTIAIVARKTTSRLADLTELAKVIGHWHNDSQHGLT